jgi:hypothetical protein
METLLKVQNKNFRLDLTGKQLTFLDTRFYLSQAGNYLPSVTTILEAYPKSAQFYDWIKKNGEDADAIRDEAGRRGSVVHGLSERYDNGEEVSLMNQDGFIDFKLGDWAMFERYVEFRNRFPEFEIEATEMNVVSDALGIGGTIDRLFTWLQPKTKKRILVDIKTSNTIWPSYWLQLSGYEKMLLTEAGIECDDVAILWLNSKTRTEGKKGDYQGKGYQLIFRGEDSKKDWELFKATQALWIAENGNQKPREMSYQLSHKIKVLEAV